MNLNNPIGYVTATWNIGVGCSNNCKGCWALKMAIRINAMAQARSDTDTWVDYSEALKWDGTTEEGGKVIGWSGVFVKRFNSQPMSRKKPERIFVQSMGDLLCSAVESKYISKVIDITNQCPQHTFLFLTQNPARYSEFEFPENCWLGTTVRTQKEAEERLNLLSKIVNNHRFVSFEPLLSNIYRNFWIPDWVIIGCKTPYHKDFKVDWMAEIIRECKITKTPVYVKQLPDSKGKAIKDLNQFPDWAKLREIPK